MNKFIKFPSIERFKSVYQAVKSRSEFVSKVDDDVVFDESRPKPVMRFFSTVKIHGTNAAVSLDKSGNMYSQSRSRILSIEQDNVGFCLWSSQPERQQLFKSIMSTYLEDNDMVVIFGEFAGGNIQKGIALNQTEKHFYPFNIATVKDDVVTYLPMEYLAELTKPELQVIAITEFPVHSFSIDFNNPDTDAIQTLCDDTEHQCPVGTYHGVEGIGEGIVLHSEDYEYRFKVKGEKHKQTSKRQLALSVDDEQFEDMQDFINQTISESRLNQGIDYLREQNLPINEKSTGAYIKWVWEDLLKEESDNIVAKQYNVKTLRKFVSKKSVSFFNQYN